MVKAANVWPGLAVGMAIGMVMYKAIGKALAEGRSPITPIVVTVIVIGMASIGYARAQKNRRGGGPPAEG